MHIALTVYICLAVHQSNIVGSDHAFDLLTADWALRYWLVGRLI